MLYRHLLLMLLLELLKLLLLQLLLCPDLLYSFFYTLPNFVGLQKKLRVQDASKLPESSRIPPPTRQLLCEKTTQPSNTSARNDDEEAREQQETREHHTRSFWPLSSQQTCQNGRELIMLYERGSGEDAC